MVFTAPVPAASGPAPSRAAGGVLSICVFCGARPGRSTLVVEAAEELGSLLGKGGHRLIYGGGGSGLMGVLAWAAYRTGGKLTGIMPSFLYERERHTAAPPQDLYLTNTMAERKAAMFDRADAFIALPGGFGTLDEVAEVLSRVYLRLDVKPLVLLDSAGFWQRFDEFVADFHLRGFARPGTDRPIALARSPVEALDVVERGVPAVLRAARADD